MSANFKGRPSISLTQQNMVVFSHLRHPGTFSYHIMFKSLGVALLICLLHQLVTADAHGEGIAVSSPSSRRLAPLQGRTSAVDDEHRKDEKIVGILQERLNALQVEASIIEQALSMLAAGEPQRG